MHIIDKMKTYNFWISLVSAVLLVARILGDKFGFEIDGSLVMDVTTAMCGVFVVLGIISAPQKVVTKYIDNAEGGAKTLTFSQNSVVKAFEAEQKASAQTEIQPETMVETQATQEVEISQPQMEEKEPEIPAQTTPEVVAVENEETDQCFACRRG